jgi:ribonuclease H2 subunit C
LRGRKIKLPAGYTGTPPPLVKGQQTLTLRSGVATKPTERLLPQQPQLSSNNVGAEDSASEAEEEDQDEKPEQVKILQLTATFNEVMLWGHDMLPAADDPFVKGIEEWIAFAEAIHAGPSPQAAPTASQATSS